VVCRAREEAWKKAVSMGIVQPNGDCAAERHDRHEIQIHKDKTGARSYSRTAEGERRRGWCIGRFSYDDHRRERSGVDERQ
jgi:hypothetical protein